MAKKKLDISKAKVADGSLKAPQSVYEMVGISSNSYVTNSRDEYETRVNKMDLIELQDEAYKHGVLASESRSITIDRLVEKFVRENSKFSVTGQEEAGSNVPMSVRDAALKALARGR